MGDKFKIDSNLIRISWLPRWRSSTSVMLWRCNSKGNRELRSMRVRLAALGLGRTRSYLLSVGTELAVPEVLRAKFGGHKRVWMEETQSRLVNLLRHHWKWQKHSQPSYVELKFGTSKPTFDASQTIRNPWKLSRCAPRPSLAEMGEPGRAKRRVLFWRVNRAPFYKSRPR